MSSLDNIMEETFEFEGSTVKDAIKTALTTLGVTRKDVIVRIVCEEKKGLFGMEGAKPAKIKVTKKIRNKS
jgi:spoIIIJ-associated protein